MGCVPGRQAEHEMPSVPFSFGPHAAQNVEWSLNAQLLPTSHGFSKQVSTDAPNVETALDHSSVGSSMVVLVMRRVVAAVTDQFHIALADGVSVPPLPVKITFPPQWFVLENVVDVDPLARCWIVCSSESSDGRWNVD